MAVHLQFLLFCRGKLEIRTGALVKSVIVEDMAVTGVELEGGERISAATVVSNADIRTTIEDLVGYRHVEAGFARKVSNVRSNGNTAKLHIALNGLPNFTGLDENQMGQRLLTPNLSLDCVWTILGSWTLIVSVMFLPALMMPAHPLVPLMSKLFLSVVLFCGVHPGSPETQ